MKKRRLIPLMLALALVITSLPVFAGQLEASGEKPTLSLARTDVPESLSYENAVSSGFVKRLYEEEASLNTAVFLNEDGSRSMLFFDENIKFEDENGIVRDKSNHLSKTRNGYTNEKNDVRVLYPTNIADDCVDPLMFFSNINFTYS